MLAKSIIALALLSVGFVQAAPLPEALPGTEGDAFIALKREPYLPWTHPPTHPIARLSQPLNRRDKREPEPGSGEPANGSEPKHTKGFKHGKHDKGSKHGSSKSEPKSNGKRESEPNSSGHVKESKHKHDKGSKHGAAKPKPSPDGKREPEPAEGGSVSGSEPKHAKGSKNGKGSKHKHDKPKPTSTSN